MIFEDDIRFSGHAVFQMAERDISHKAVLQCLNNADKVVQERAYRHRAMKIFQKDKKDYLLVVVYDEKAKQTEIVTVFITSKVQKYL